MQEYSRIVPYPYNYCEVGLFSYLHYGVLFTGPFLGCHFLTFRRIGGPFHSEVLGRY